MGIKRNIMIMHHLFGKCEGHVCGECFNLQKHTANRSYFKCVAYGNSASEASDFRKKNVACGLFNKPYKNDIPVKDFARSLKINSEDEQIPGQISLWDWLIEVEHGRQSE